MESPLTEMAGTLYETLDSLTFSENLDNLGNYDVFRNRISVAADPLPNIAATDFLSLDLDAPESPTPQSDAVVVPEADGDEEKVEASESAWFRAGSRFKSPMLQLHQEILDFANFVSPTREEQISRDAAVHRISDVVKHIWPHCRVEVFGSFRTGLYLPSSDIDVAILGSNVKTPQVGLYALSRALSQRSLVTKLQVIAKARVPIIKFVEKQSGIAFDISFDADGGPKAADYIKDVVQRIPPLRPLCLVLKVFLHQRELNEVFLGGIGSYALLTMLITFLQMHWREQSLLGYHENKEHNLGILLVNFFDFFGRKLNTSDIGISCNSRKNFFLKTKKGFMNEDKPYLIAIEDPQAPENDIGKNSYNYYKVKSAFSVAYSSLTDSKAILRLGSQRSILGLIIRPDPVMLDRKAGNNGELTFKNLLPGAGEPVDNEFDKSGDVICNWQLMDEEPLPREKLKNEDYDDNLSSQKRIKKSRHRNRSTEYHDSNNGEGGSKSEKQMKKNKKRSREKDFVLSNNLPRRWKTH